MVWNLLQAWRRAALDPRSNWTKLLTAGNPSLHHCGVCYIPVFPFQNSPILQQTTIRSLIWSGLALHRHLMELCLSWYLSLCCCVESKCSRLSLCCVPEGTQCLLSVLVVARGMDFLACLCFTSDGNKLHHMPADTLKQTQDNKQYADVPVSVNRTVSSASVVRARFFFWTSLCMCRNWGLIMACGGFLVHSTAGEAAAQLKPIFSFMLFTFVPCGNSLGEHIPFLLPRGVFHLLKNPQSGNVL